MERARRVVADARLDLGRWRGCSSSTPTRPRCCSSSATTSGTAKAAGLRWANPFYSKKTVSLRVRNFETGKLKVNDKDGNPIEIAAVVVWKVVDTAEALFDVDDYENFVHVQSESALRNLATALPLRRRRARARCRCRSHTAEISGQLRDEIQERLAQAGVEVHRGAHQPPRLRAGDRARDAAAPAGERRRRRARRRSSRARSAWSRWRSRCSREKKIVELDDERRAAMVSNLLVVLCSDRHPQPVINTGTLYN